MWTSQTRLVLTISTFHLERLISICMYFQSFFSLSVRMSSLLWLVTRLHRLLHLEWKQDWMSVLSPSHYSCAVLSKLSNFPSNNFLSLFLPVVPTHSSLIDDCFLSFRLLVSVVRLRLRFYQRRGWCGRSVCYSEGGGSRHAACEVWRMEKFHCHTKARGRWMALGL